MRARLTHRFASALVALLAAGTSFVAPVPALAQAAAAAMPQETDGQINGKKARFVAQGNDVLLTVAEAERLGLRYRDGKSITIGGTPLWLVTLDSVGVDGRARVMAPAGVVPSIPDYFAALRAHPAEAFARSREMQVELNGVPVKAYDMGIAGVLVSPAEADRAGLKYRSGKAQRIGNTDTWGLEAPIKTPGQAAPANALITVAEPEPFFEAAMAGAVKPK